MGDEPMTEPNDLTNTHADHDSVSLTTLEDDAATAEGTSSNQNNLTNGRYDHVSKPRGDAPLSELDKSDSEAETVVLPGKEKGDDYSGGKAIKLEDNGSESDSSPRKKETRNIRSRTEVDGGRRQALKRKRGEEEPGSSKPVNHQVDEHNSSDLSSNRSSPILQTRSSKTSESRSNGSISPAPNDGYDDVNDDGGDGGGRVRKRTPGDNKKPNKRRSGHAPVIERSKHSQSRQVDQDSTAHLDRAQRSESPQSNLKSRVRSTQSNGSAHSASKRRKPAPLNVDRRRRTPEDANFDSDDSISIHDHTTQRFPSGEAHAMSPAKVSHKKNIDRSGRTLLARACAIGYDETLRWIRERPQDINQPDYAGNTPLQIASLHGKDEVVELLLKERCDITCKNADGDTPLIDAVENSCLGVVKLLLQAGVDPRQRNAKGQQPIELVDSDEDESHAIRQALIEARNKSDATRRQSEDQRHHMRDTDTPSAQASAASPSEETRSPPPMLEATGRKRTARSQQSDDALLWINPTPQRLREEAGKGNLKFVGHILGMRPEAHTDAVIAAVKGGHHEVLGHMIALAAPEPNPSPLQTTDQQPGQNTPMLAAIGRGNLDVIKLLLDQIGFDPTRRVYKGLTYSELAAERKGDNWEEERDMLQAAFDDYQRSGGRKSNSSSPKKLRKSRTGPKDLESEPPSCPQEIRRVRKSHTQVKEDPDQEIKRRPSYLGTALKQRGSADHETSSTAPDRSHPRSGGTKPKNLDRPRSAGHENSLGISRTDTIKPRRKLMSGNELRTGQDVRRKFKAASDEEMESPASAKKPRHRQSFSTQMNNRSVAEEATSSTISLKKASSEEPARTQDDASRKRMRVSMSPRTSKSELPEVAKLKKRQKLGSREEPADVAKPPSSSPTDPNAVPSSLIAVKSPAQGAAPVAFMGAATASPATMSPTECQPLQPSTTFPDNSNDGPSHGANLDSHPESAQDIEQAQAENIEHQRVEAALKQEEERKHHENLQREKEETERQARLQREAEEARLDVQRRKEEQERQAHLEREAEEARIVKAKRDEELQRRHMEEEKRRREEQDRKRREREEREALHRVRLLEEQKRARMEALPNGLRRVVEIGPDKAREGKEIKRWLPLRTATSKDLDLDRTGEPAKEQWIANIQAAPLLANEDLDLSQCTCALPKSFKCCCSHLIDTALTRFKASRNHINFLWRQLRNPMSQNPTPLDYLGYKEAIELDSETKPKFFDLHIFWVKLSDFMEVVPRHSHLAGIQLSTRPMAFFGFQFAKPMIPASQQRDLGAGTPPLVNGNITNDGQEDMIT